MTIKRTKSGYTITRDDGTSVILSNNECSLLVNQIGRDGLRASIEDRLHEADQDWIDISRYPFSFDELVDEIFEYFEDTIDYGNSVDDDDIDDYIGNIASNYNMMLN